jgi:hypothetical protein
MMSPVFSAIDVSIYQDIAKVLELAIKNSRWVPIFSELPDGNWIGEISELGVYVEECFLDDCIYKVSIEIAKELFDGNKTY